MIHFRKIWDKPKHDFLMEHREDPIKECYRLFLQTFQDAHDVTETAFRNERSRIGAIAEKYKNQNKNHSSREPKPLFSEQEKKGYVKIKIEQPNKWMFKHHYVWWQKTGHKPDSKKEIVIFLDGNNRNFDFHNLFLMPRKCIAIFNNKNISSGTIPGNPEATKINAMNAILIHKIFNAGRKAGLVSESSGRFKTDINEYQKNRMRNLTPEQLKIEKEKRQKYWQKIKSDPQKHEELKSKRREMYKKWKQKKTNDLSEYFSANGRITSLPFRTDSHSSGTDQVTIKFYKIKCLMTYSIQAQIQKRIYCKWPHPQDGLFESVWECKKDAEKCLQLFCEQNKLKKAYNRLVPVITCQLDLFDDLY